MMESQIFSFAEMKPNYAQCEKRFHQISLAERVPALQVDVFKIAELRLCVVLVFCHEAAGFSRFEPIVTENDIFRLSGRTKHSTALRKSQL